MDFSLSEEQSALQDLARKILEDLATNERLKQIEASEPVFDRELWSELAKANLLGVAIPEAHGGSEFGYFALCLLLQEIGRAVAPVPVLASLALGGLPVARFGSDAQKQEILPQVADGSVILTAGLQELDSDDPLSPSTSAKREGSGWRLEGQKAAVPAAQLAQKILIPARTEDGRIGVFLVDPSAAGVAVESQAISDRQPYGLVILSGVAVGEAELLGDLDRGAEILQWIVERATVAVCALQLGLSERALEMTAAYGRERIQFDRPIGSFQAFHQRASDTYINIEAVRLSTWEAAWRLEQSDPANAAATTDAVTVAKYWAAEGGQLAAYACVHLHGGIGIDVDYPLHRYFIWSMQCEHTLGSAGAQLARLGARMAAGTSD